MLTIHSLEAIERPLAAAAEVDPISARGLCWSGDGNKVHDPPPPAPPPPFHSSKFILVFINVERTRKDHLPQTLVLEEITRGEGVYGLTGIFLLQL